MTTLILSPSKTDTPTKKRGGERGLVGASGQGSVKMILTLLTKMVAIHVRFSKVQVRKPGLKRTLSGLRLTLTLSLTLE